MNKKQTEKFIKLYLKFYKKYLDDAIFSIDDEKCMLENSEKIWEFIYSNNASNQMHVGCDYNWFGILPICGISQSCSGCEYSKREEICHHSRNFINYENIRIWDVSPSSETSSLRKKTIDFVYCVYSYAINKLIDLFIKDNEITIKEISEDRGMNIYLQQLNF